MANELQLTASWTFFQEVKVPNDVSELFVEGEQALTAFKTVRDVAIFTDRRLIVKDSQGITGKKIEVYSLPYSSISMYSTENAGMFDFNQEVELWTRAGHIKINLGKGADVRRIDRLLANALVGDMTAIDIDSL